VSDIFYNIIRAEFCPWLEVNMNKDMFLKEGMVKW
jgi:hypothetical protein